MKYYRRNADTSLITPQSKMEDGMLMLLRVSFAGKVTNLRFLFCRDIVETI